MPTDFPGIFFLKKIKKILIILSLIKSLIKSLIILIIMTIYLVLT